MCCRAVLSRSCLLAVCLFAESVAFAQGGDRTAATALYDEATKLVQAGKNAEACPKL